MPQHFVISATHDADDSLQYSTVVHLCCASLQAGAHSIGKGRCVNFRLRLSPKQDPLLDTDYADGLRDICNLNAGAPVNMDPVTPGVLDNQVQYDTVQCVQNCW